MFGPVHLCLMRMPAGNIAEHSVGPSLPSLCLAQRTACASREIPTDFRALAVSYVHFSHYQLAQRGRTWRSINSIAQI